MSVDRSPKTKAELHASAVALARQYQLVKHNSQLFIPVSWYLPVVDETPPDPGETIWLPMSTDDVLEFGNNRGRILFQSQSEFISFSFMLQQEARRPERMLTDRIFIKTDAGLRVLDPGGQLIEPSGEFIPNVLGPKLNPDPDAQHEVYAVLEEWLGSRDAVESLLFHLATMLAPGWSASKLILLLGKGRNGKSTLLKMIEALLGSGNVSHVTRQQMAAREPAIVDLNNKLANIVYDAESTYLKDSSTEKTLVVGETVGVRLLYSSTNTNVWTNGLFIEGLNEEPKSRDKTNALQRRLVRFYFPNEYPLNRTFERHMLSEDMLGAFLALLVEHFVQENEQAEKLIPSQASYDLQVEQLWQNSKSFQFVHELVSKDPANASRLIGMEVPALVDQFHAWLMKGKDDYSAVDAQRMLKECFEMKRVSKRDGKTIRKVWVIEAYTPDAHRMIETLTEGGDGEDGLLDAAALVED